MQDEIYLCPRFADSAAPPKVLSMSSGNVLDKDHRRHQAKILKSRIPVVDARLFSIRVLCMCMVTVLPNGDCRSPDRRSKGQPRPLNAVLFLHHRTVWAPNTCSMILVLSHCNIRSPRALELENGGEHCTVLSWNRTRYASSS